jgi:hypothetical protein
VARLRLQLQTDPNLDYGPLEAEARRAAQLFETLGDEGAAAAAWDLLYEVAWFRCQFAAAQEAAERAVASPGHRRNRRDMELAIAAFGTTPTSVALALADTMLAAVRGSPGEEARVRYHAASLRAMRGDFESARELALQAVAGFEELGASASAADANCLLGWFVERLSGDWTAAESALRRGYEELAALGETAWLSTIAPCLALCLVAQGRDDEAEEYASIGAGKAQAEDAISQVLWRSARAKLLARRGESLEAKALARDACDVARAGEFLALRGDALLDLAEVLRTTERPDEARGVVHEALATFERKEHLVGARRARELLGQLDAAAAAAP